MQGLKKSSLVQSYMIENQINTVKSVWVILNLDTKHSQWQYEKSIVQPKVSVIWIIKYFYFNSNIIFCHFFENFMHWCKIFFIFTPLLSQALPGPSASPKVPVFFFNNPLSPICAAHILMDAELFNGVWLTYQGPRPSEGFFPPPEALSVSSYSARGWGLWASPSSLLECWPDWSSVDLLACSMFKVYLRGIYVRMFTYHV